MSKNTTLEDFKMISLAKEKEYLDLEEGGEALTQELVGHEPIDDMLLIFEETDIQLLDAAPRGRSKEKPRSGAALSRSSPSSRVP